MFHRSGRERGSPLSPRRSNIPVSSEGGHILRFTEIFNTQVRQWTMPMSNSRGLVVKVGHVLLLFMSLLVPQRVAQDIPPKSETAVRDTEKESFLNSHVVLLGDEWDVYLYKGVERNFTITVEEKGPFSVTVTPCVSPISWLLLFRRGKSGNFKEVSRYKGEGRQTFRATNGEAGRYLLQVMSLEIDSYLKIFATSQPDVTVLHPVLPPNSQVKVNVSDKNNVFSIDWSSAASYNREPVEYCLTISRLKDFQTYCGALAYVNGDKKPQFTRWDAKNEKQKIIDARKKARPVKKAPARMIFHRCLSNRTSYMHTGIRRGKTYFVNVFVVNQKSRAASAYTGSSVTTKRLRKSSTVRMRVGETKTLKLRQKHKVLLYLNATVPRLAFEVVPCEGRIPFEIYHNGRKVQRKTVAKRWKRRLIQLAGPGVYLLTFPRTSKKTFVTVSITSNSTWSKIFLPKKFVIKVFQKLTTCSNVTLAWMVTPENQKYCVYKKKLRSSGGDQLRKQCLNPDKRPEAERDVCLFSNATSVGRREVMKHVVLGLSPGTLYRFDVFVSHGKSASVPYRSVKVRTTSQCHSELSRPGHFGVPIK